MSPEVIINLITSIAVIISVIFVSIEIKKNTQAVRSNFYDSFANSNREFLNQLIMDQGLANLFEKAIHSWENLDENEQRRSNFMSIQMFRIWENLYYQNKMDVLESWLWTSHKNTINSYFHYPGIQQWWKVRRMTFAKEFVTFLENSKAPGEQLMTIQELNRPSE